MTRARTRKQERRAQPAPATGANAAVEPSQDAVARRAYELYLERGGADGQDVDDWLQAEQQLGNGETRRTDTD